MSSNEGVNLKRLEESISTLADKVRELKSSSSSKEEIKGVVEELLKAKEDYARLNNGIGVDGKPFQDPKKTKSKGELKKTAKLEAAKGGKKEIAKAAKKEAKKAKKTENKIEDGKNEKVSCVHVKRNIVQIVCGQMELKFNPNAKAFERPLVTLSTLIMLNKIEDVKVTLDHRCPLLSPLFGTKEGSVIQGDVSIAKYLCKLEKNKTLIGDTVEEEAHINQWIEYSLKMLQNQELLMKSVEERAKQFTFLELERLTLADLAMFKSLNWPMKSAKKNRWMSMLSCHPCLKEATQLACVNEEEVTLMSGMSLLEGGVRGQVCTRFPPEPSGYLHIGHAKAVLLNDYYARSYQGRLIVRMDDTNPSKEKEEYLQSILEDLKVLGVIPNVLTYTSDYLNCINEYAIFMIKQGLAFMDDTPQEKMQQERMNKIPSSYRNQSIQENLKYFKLMASGCEEGSKWCCRAKIDMSSNNGTLRDPVIYRQNLIPHHRTGTTYKAYPTYDFACPLVDAFEGVTHALRTTEYNDRDEQYMFFQRLLVPKLRTRIHSFARMNFQYTVLSKRKLAWFVENNYVTGWDDPRFPTIRGVIRRGVNVPKLRNFICSQGASRRVTNMEWSKFWAENKKEIDTFAKRFMAIDANQHVVCSIQNVPPLNHFITTDYHPKQISLGKRLLHISNKVLLENSDVQDIQQGEQIVLMRWGVIQITNIVDSKNIQANFIPDGNIKACKRKLSWVSTPSTFENYYSPTSTIITEFDNLLSKAKLEDDDSLQDFINPHTFARTTLIGDASLKTCQKHDIIQLERRGYFRVDQPFMNDKKPLILFMIPDGKSKSMGGLVGKLSHH